MTDYKALRAICRQDLNKQAFKELDVALSDAARYRHLRDHTGNKLMRKLMNFCTSEAWNEAVDADMATPETATESNNGN